MRDRPMCHHFEAEAEREAYYERLREEFEAFDEPAETFDESTDEPETGTEEPEERPEPTAPADD